MKRFFLAVLTAFTTFAFGATTMPVQLLNAAGSTAGQAIVSNGPTSAPTWGAVPLSGISGTLAIANGGTGATSAPNARTNLGLGTIATQSASSVAVTGGAINGTPVGVTTSAAGAFTTLAAAGNDALLYSSSNALSVPSATVVTLTTFTKVFDRVNANFNAATGAFTAPVTGYYVVSASVEYTSAANVVGARFGIAVQVAGSTITGAGAGVYLTATGASPVGVTWSGVVFATQGQAITVVVTQNSGATRTLSSGNLSITRVP